MKKFRLIVLLIFHYSAIFGQFLPEPQYNFQLPFIQNPAFSGFYKKSQMTISVRKQWLGIENSPSEQVFHINQRYEKSNFGILLMNKTHGALIRQNAGISFSHGLKIKKKSLQHVSFGLFLGVERIKIQSSKLDPLQENDPLLSGAFNSIFVPAANVGIIYRIKSLYTGIAVNNLLNFDYTALGSLSYSKQDNRAYCFTAGKKIKLGKTNRMKFRISAMEKSSNWYLSNYLVFEFQNKFQSGFALNFIRGSGFRSADLSLGIPLSAKLYLSYIVAFPFSEIGHLSNGSHLLSLSFDFRSIKKIEECDAYN